MDDKEGIIYKIESEDGSTLYLYPNDEDPESLMLHIKCSEITTVYEDEDGNEYSPDEDEEEETESVEVVIALGREPGRLLATLIHAFFDGMFGKRTFSAENVLKAAESLVQKKKDTNESL